MKLKIKLKTFIHSTYFLLHLTIKIEILFYRVNWKVFNILKSIHDVVTQSNHEYYNWNHKTTRVIKSL